MKLEKEGLVLISDTWRFIPESRLESESWLIAVEMWMESGQYVQALALRGGYNDFRTGVILLKTLYKLLDDSRRTAESIQNYTDLV